MEHQHVFLKPAPQFRQYRAEHQDGQFEIIRKTIRKPQDLEAWIKENNPKNVYETTATFWNPKTIRGIKKSSYKWTQQIIDHLVLIDIDELNSTEVLKVLDFFKARPRYKFWKLVCSGGGYHVYYEDSTKPTEVELQRRLEWFRLERKGLAEELVGAGINFDVPVLTDPYRISRVIGSWNGNKSAWCREITIDELIDKPKIILKKNNMKELKKKVYTALYFISNKVPHIKNRYVPVMIWPKTFNYKSYLTPSLELGKLYVFELSNKIMALSLKTVSSERLTTILKKTHSSNLTSWIKYKHCWIYLAYKNFKKEPDFSNEKIREVIRAFQRPRFLEVLDMGPINSFISKPHSKILGAETESQLQHGAFPLRENLVVKHGYA